MSETDFPSEDKHLSQETGILSSLDIAEDSQLYILDPIAERKLVWKLDTRILPVLAAMYLFNSLDKSNLGNAKTAGLDSSLNLQGNQYNIILSVFFVPYVLTAPFLGILGKKYGPNRVLPLMMLCFGLVTTMVTVVKNFAGLMTIRWFLGMAESAFFPLVIYYQTTYILGQKGDRRLRVGFIGEENLRGGWRCFMPHSQLRRRLVDFLPLGCFRFSRDPWMIGGICSLLRDCVLLLSAYLRFSISLIMRKDVVSSMQRKRNSHTTVSRSILRVS